MLLKAYGEPDPVLSETIPVPRMTGSTSEVIYADAKKIHGELYEEAESFEKTPVLGSAPAVGWEPRIALDELIQETIEYYRPIVAGRSA